MPPCLTLCGNVSKSHPCSEPPFLQLVQQWLELVFGVQRGSVSPSMAQAQAQPESGLLKRAEGWGAGEDGPSLLPGSELQKNEALDFKPLRDL